MEKYLVKINTSDDMLNELKDLDITTNDVLVIKTKNKILYFTKFRNTVVGINSQKMFGIGGDLIKYLKDKNLEVLSYVLLTDKDYSFFERTYKYVEINPNWMNHSGVAGELVRDLTTWERGIHTSNKYKFIDTSLGLTQYFLSKVQNYL